MFKNKNSFIFTVVVIIMMSCYSFGGDIIYIIKRTLDERVATLERKVAMMDLYFAERGVDLERAYGNRIQMVQEGGTVQRNSGTVIVIDGNTHSETPSPRNQGRYLVTFKDGSKMVIVTFEKTKTSKEAYTFHLENGQRVQYQIKNIEDMKFIPYHTEE